MFVRSEASVFLPGSFRSSCLREGWRSRRRGGWWRGPFHKQPELRLAGRLLWLASSAKTPAKLPPHLLQHTRRRGDLSGAAPLIVFFALSSALNAAARLLISSWLNSAACSPNIKGGTCGVGGRSHHGCRRLFLKVFRGGGRGVDGWRKFFIGVVQTL